MQPVFRFAPSPNGYLHLGHAYSALLNQEMARETGGRLLLRIEDIDTMRCRPELVAATFEDLRWLGFAWEEPVLRQSEHFLRYRAALDRLGGVHGVIYPCFCTRSDVARAFEQRRASGKPAANDPDGAPLYSGVCRSLPQQERAARVAAGTPHVFRLDLASALRLFPGPVCWNESGKGAVNFDVRLWGDVVLARKDTPTSYHLSAVVDDALQGVTDVVRGRDLFAATAIHRLLQMLLELPEPRYHHHALITGKTGEKLAKSRASTPLRQLRAEGRKAADIRRDLGFA